MNQHQHAEYVTARCRFCGEEISFPDAVDLNGRHYPVFDRKVWRDDSGFWHDDCHRVQIDGS